MSRLTRMMARLRHEFGNECSICGAHTRLQFAHITPTGLNGKGRGGLMRAYDIQRNRDSYRLLCVSCHRKFDQFLRNCHDLRIRVGGQWYLGKRLRRTR